MVTRPWDIAQQGFPCIGFTLWQLAKVTTSHLGLPPIGLTSAQVAPLAELRIAFGCM